VGVDSPGDARKAADLVLRASKEYSKLANGFTHKEAVVMILLENADSLNDFLNLRPQCLSDLYREAVTSLVPTARAYNCLRQLKEENILVGAYGIEHRGVIGGLAALGVVFNDYTFELLTYRKPSNLARKRVINEDTVISFDLRYKPLTFMNYDYETSRLLIAPHGLDPVLYGVRGEEPSILVRALNEIVVYEEPSHWTLFRTNQATNAHLRSVRSIDSIHPYDNIVARGLLREVRRISGGHVVGKLCLDSGCISVAFYRETGRLREAAIDAVNSEVEIGGQVKPHAGTITLNAEYLKITCTGEIYYPPLAAYHHLMKPPERMISRVEKTRRLRPPSKESLIHSPHIEVD
jgi:tRNA(Ile2)-agmatinylcytidine synthase